MKSLLNIAFCLQHKYGFIIVLVVLLFASCQPAHIIPDEARKVTVSFEQGEVIPPPRNTNDLIELLKSKMAPVKAAIVKARAEKQPPATQDPKTRYSFFSERASSAFTMGRVLQAVSDREKAAFYAQKGYGDTSEEYSKALWHLANLCEDTMEIDKAIWTMINSLNALPSSRRTHAGWNNEFQRYVFIARCSAWIGDYSMAEDYLKRAESALNVHLTAQNWPQEKIAKMKCRILGPKIGILHGQGKYRDAELLRREKLAYYKDFKSDFNRALDLYYLSDTLYQQGRFVESEMEARKGLNAMFKHGGSSSFPSIAYLIYGVARPILASGRYQDAEKLARTALEIFNEIGASDKTLPKASLYAILMEALFLQDRWEEAAKYLQLILSNFSMDSPIFLIELKARGIWFAISSKFHLTEASLQEAEKTEKLIIRREGQESIHAKQAIGLQALLLESMGKHSEALERFRKIRPILVGEDRKLQFSGTKNRTDAKIWKTIG